MFVKGLWCFLRFSGLVAFPFDSLKCAMEWGGWILSDGFQGVELTESGFTSAHSEDTAGMSYQEYSIDQVTVSLKTTYYDVSPEHPWTILKYTIELRLASDVASCEGISGTGHPSTTAY